MKLKYLSFLIIPVIGLSLLNKSKLLKANAQTFVASDWSLVAPSGLDPWTQKEGDALISTNEKWFPANFLVNNSIDSYNLTDEGRLAFQLKTSFHSEVDAATLHTAQWRGFNLFYLNNSNWLSAGVKWDASATTHRADPVEMQEMMVYGKINGEWYSTWGASSWEKIEYHDLWTDNCGFHITDPMELTLQYTPVAEGSNINNDTDLIALTLKVNSKVVYKEQRLRSLSDNLYFDLDGNLANMHPGLFTINTDAIAPDAVSFTSFEYTPIKPTFGDYTKVTQGFVDSQIYLPIVVASTVLEEYLQTTVTVKDPDNLDVEIVNNRFIPTKKGEYTVTYTAVDKYHSTGSDSYTFNVGDGLAISYSGEKVTSGKIGDTITLPSFYVDGHPEISIDVSIKDPNDNDVVLNANTFVPALEGEYTVIATSITPNVAPLQYQITITDPNIPHYEIKEDGERVTSGHIGDKIVIPHYYVENHEEIGVTVAVTNPLDEEVTLYKNAFSATKEGAYKVHIEAEQGHYEIEDIDYVISISRIDDGGGESGDKPSNPDPNTYSYAYGKRSAEVIVLLVSISLGVSLVSVGSYFLVRFIQKRKDKHE